MDEPRTFRFLHQLAHVHLTGKETAGTLSVVEATGPAGPAAPLHVHRREDETFYVLEGELTLLIGERVHRAGAGSLVYAPRDVAHTFTVDSPTARWLVVSTPSDFEEFVACLGSSADAAEAPAAPDPERLAAVAASFGIDILGPPLAVEELLAAAAA